MHTILIFVPNPRPSWRHLLPFIRPFVLLGGSQVRVMVAASPLLPMRLRSRGAEAGAASWVVFSTTSDHGLCRWPFTT